MAGGSSKQPYTLWLEGYAATGQQESAKCLGTYEGSTFEEACAEWARKTPQPSYYNAERNTYWRCRFFDNEADARRSFG